MPFRIWLWNFFGQLQKYYNTLHLTCKILYKFASQSFESEQRHHRSVEIIIIEQCPLLQMQINREWEGGCDW